MYRSIHTFSSCGTVDELQLWASVHVCLCQSHLFTKTFCLHAIRSLSLFFVTCFQLCFVNMVIKPSTTEAFHLNFGKFHKNKQPERTITYILLCIALTQKIKKYFAKP